MKISELKKMLSEISDDLNDSEILVNVYNNDTKIRSEIKSVSDLTIKTELQSGKINLFFEN